MSLADQYSGKYPAELEFLGCSMKEECKELERGIHARLRVSHRIE